MEFWDNWKLRLKTYLIILGCLIILFGFMYGACAAQMARNGIGGLLGEVYYVATNFISNLNPIKFFVELFNLSKNTE